MIVFRCPHCPSWHPSVLQLVSRTAFEEQRETKIKDRCPATDRVVTYRLRAAIREELH